MRPSFLSKIMASLVVFLLITSSVELAGIVYLDAQENKQRWGLFKHEYIGGEDSHLHLVAIHDAETGQEIVCAYPSRAGDDKGISCWLTGRSWK